MKLHHSVLWMNVAATLVHLGIVLSKDSLVSFWQDQEPFARRFAASIIDPLIKPSPVFEWKTDPDVSCVLEPAQERFRNVTPFGAIPYTEDSIIYVELAPTLEEEQRQRRQQEEQDKLNQDNDATLSEVTPTTFAFVKDWFRRALQGKYDHAHMPSFYEWVVTSSGQEEQPPPSNTTATSSVGLSSFATTTTDISALGFFDYDSTAHYYSSNSTFSRHTADEILWNTATHATHVLWKSAAHHTVQFVPYVHRLWETANTGTQNSIFHSTSFLYARFTTLVVNPAANTLSSWTSSSSDASPNKYKDHSSSSLRDNHQSNKSLLRNASQKQEARSLPPNTVSDSTKNTPSFLSLFAIAMWKCIRLAGTAVYYVLDFLLTTEIYLAELLAIAVICGLGMTSWSFPWHFGFYIMTHLILFLLFVLMEFHVVDRLFPLRNQPRPASNNPRRPQANQGSSHPQANQGSRRPQSNQGSRCPREPQANHPSHDPQGNQRASAASNSSNTQGTGVDQPANGGGVDFEWHFGAGGFDDQNEGDDFFFGEHFFNGDAQPEEEYAQREEEYARPEEEQNEDDAGANAAIPEQPTREDYRVLGLRFNATFAECKRKYRRMIRDLHPDRNPGRDTNEQTALINDAYTRISDWNKYQRGEWNV